jgi:drug/metabolite transporter (DMT)-like permease
MEGIGKEAGEQGDEAARHRRHVLGMWLMACVALVFASQDALSKMLIFSMPVIFVAWMRYLVHTGLVTGAIALGKGPRVFRTRRPWLHLLRACCLLADSLTFLFGLQHVPLAESTALVFLAPAFVTMLSPWLFGIRANRYQWLSVIVGFCGVLVIINPASDAFSPWMLFPLATAFFFALYQMLTQLAGESDGPAVCSFYVGLFCTVLLSLAVPFFWIAPTPMQWLLLVALGCMGLCAHFVMAKSYTCASSADLAPLGYLQIIFAAGYGLVVFGNAPGVASLAGMALIVASGLLVYWKQGATRRAMAVA